MSTAYEVQINDSMEEEKGQVIDGVSIHHEHADESTSMLDQQDMSENGNDDGQNRSSANEQGRNQSSRTSSNGQRVLGRGTPELKSPSGKSYKYPVLRQYFEFGPWVGRNRKALCLSCRHQSSSSQPDRLLKHLKRCSALCDEDKEIVEQMMNERGEVKRTKPMTQVRIRSSTNGSQDEEYYDDGYTGADDLSTPHHNSSSISIPSGSKRLRRDHPDRKSHIDQALTRFIMVCRIPLKSIHSKEFIDLCHALDPDYRIPSREAITNVLIPGLLNII